jgi:type 1 glutamine amidotransferase
MKLRQLLVLGVASIWLVPASAREWPQPARATKIVFVAGPKDHGRPGRHEYEKNLSVLKSCLEQASNVKGIAVELRTGQVPDARELADAAAIVVESSGDRTPKETHAIFPQADTTDGKSYDAATMERLERFDALMKKGTGLVGIHYSTWVNNETGRRFWLDWLGGVAHYGQDDSKVRVTDWSVTPATPDHPVLRGIKPWTYREEYYLDELMPPDPRRTPLLSVTPSDGGPGGVVAWAVEREGGGRGVVTTGSDFHDNMFNEQHRRFLANAVLWAARVEVPRDGVVCQVTREPTGAP